MIDSILNFIFPIACVICRTPVLQRHCGAACPACWDSLAPVPSPFCPQCGVPVVAIEGRCARFRLGETRFDLARSAVLFNDSARRIVHHLKYSDRVSLAKPMGRMLRDVFDRNEFRGGILVPVPLHRARRRERGFNQAELIARATGLPVDAYLVRRRRNTRSQTGLSRFQRAGNLSGAFEVDRKPSPKGIILVDDVLTTGATMNEISKVLKRAGAERVEVLTFARVPGDVNPPESSSEPLR